MRTALSSALLPLLAAPLALSLQLPLIASSSLHEAEPLQLVRATLSSSALPQLRAADVDVWHVAPCAGPSAAASSSASICARIATPSCAALQKRAVSLLACEVLHEDIAALVREQHSNATVAGQRGSSPSAEFDDAYHTLEQLEARLHDLAALFPSLVSLESIGETHEGRPIRSVRLGAARSETGKTKPAVVISAGSHAREWIAPAVALHFISSLLASSAAARAPALLELFTIVVIPVLNPDGYAHSQSSPAARLWRKNRAPNAGAPDACKGTDVGAGFPSHFVPSANPCADAYAGRKPLEAAETRALAALLSDQAQNVVGFFDLHSYGQQMTYPYAYSCDEALPDEEDLAELAIGAVRALRAVHRFDFGTGRGCEALYPTTGTAMDFAYEHDVKWAYSLELRDEGEYGFLLPAEYIRPAGEETTAALRYALAFIARKMHLS